ncbi:MAG: class I SAM-dependent methyltransferase [Gammaproteobacteria bacterium]
MNKHVEHEPSRQAPHPVLTRFYRREQERQTRVNAMFDAAAGHYDHIERLMSFGTGRHYRREALARAGVRNGMRVLDVGCGTGLLATQAAAITGPGRVVAIDPSIGMLNRARVRGAPLAVRGVGEALPFADHSFDVISMGYALRHVADLQRTFREFRRVLKPGGVVLMLEITPPASRPAYALLKVYLKYLIPAAVRLARRSREAGALMSYYWATIEECVPPASILDALRRAGFERAERRVEIGIFSAYTAVSA